MMVIMLPARPPAVPPRPAPHGWRGQPQSSTTEPLSRLAVVHPATPAWLASTVCQPGMSAWQHHDSGNRSAACLVSCCCCDLPLPVPAWQDGPPVCWSDVKTVLSVQSSDHHAHCTTLRCTSLACPSPRLSACTSVGRWSGSAELTAGLLVRSSLPAPAGSAAGRCKHLSPLLHL